MTLSINLSAENTSTVIADAQEASVILTNSDNNLTSSNRDKIVHTLTLGDAKHHTPGGADKSEGADSLASVSVPMESFYKWVTFHDVQADDEPEIVAQVVNKLPGALALTADKDAFGTHFDADNPFDALTTNSMDVDASAESWQAAIDSLSDAGFTADTLLLTNQAKTLLKEAYAQNANTNTLRDNTPTQVSGANVFFRKLSTGSLVDGDVVGIVYDSTQLVTYQKSEIEVDYYSRKENASLRVKNLDATYCGTQIGIAPADADAFCYLVYRETSV